MMILMNENVSVAAAGCVNEKSQVTKVQHQLTLMFSVVLFILQKCVHVMNQNQHLLNFTVPIHQLWVLMSTQFSFPTSVFVVELLESKRLSDITLMSGACWDKSWCQLVIDQCCFSNIFHCCHLAKKKKKSFIVGLEETKLAVG